MSVQIPGEQVQRSEDESNSLGTIGKMDLEEGGPSTSVTPQPNENMARTWDDPTNVENPHNWPLWNKILHSAIPALYGFALTVGMSTYVAGLPGVMQQFNVSRNVALLPIVVYTLGFTLGPLIAAPISEIYGRLIIYRTNLPMLLVFNAIAAASDNFPVLIVFRFLAGFGGSGVLAVGAGMSVEESCCMPYLICIQALLPTYGTHRTLASLG
jgi:hypothetical protein